MRDNGWIEDVMFRKSTYCALGFAAFLVFGGASLWENARIAIEPLRAEGEAAKTRQISPICFLNDYDEALRIAAQENKPALLFFMSRDCKFSQKMLDVAFADPSVEELAQEFVCVEVDMDDPANERLCENFEVVASPTVQFLSSYGVPLRKIASVQTSETLVAQMQAALASVAWRAAHLGENGKIMR